MHFFEYRDGVLHAEGVALPDLARASKRPSIATARRRSAGISRCSRRRSSDFDALVCYAMKANSNQAVLTLLAGLGAGMDVVSEGELRRAQAAKVPGERVTFSGVGKTDREIALGARLRHPLFQRRIRAGAGAHLADRGLARPDRPHRDSRQSGRRRQNPRQDLDRKIGKQIRRSDFQSPATFTHAADKASRRRDRRRGHAYRLADHRSRAFRQRLRAAGRFRAAIARRRPRHLIIVDLGGGLGIPYSEREDPGELPSRALCRNRPPPHQAAGRRS